MAWRSRARSFATISKQPCATSLPAQAHCATSQKPSSATQTPSSWADVGNETACPASFDGDPDRPDHVARVLRACNPGTARLQVWAASGRVYSRHDAGGDG